MSLVVDGGNCWMIFIVNGGMRKLRDGFSSQQKGEEKKKEKKSLYFMLASLPELYLSQLIDLVSHN